MIFREIERRENTDPFPPCPRYEISRHCHCAFDFRNNDYVRYSVFDLICLHGTEQNTSRHQGNVRKYLILSDRISRPDRITLYDVEIDEICLGRITELPSSNKISSSLRPKKNIPLTNKIQATRVGRDYLVGTSSGLLWSRGKKSTIANCLAHLTRITAKTYTQTAP